MSKVPPYRYGSAEDRAVDMINRVSQGAPAEFDTLQEVAAEIQELRNQIAALQGGTPEISFLLIE